MPSFPSIGGSPAMYPMVDEVSVPTRVIKFCNDSEQRWPTRKPLQGFTLEYADLSKVEAETIETFFVARKGSYEVFDITLMGLTFTKMRFLDDALQVTETAPGLYSLTLRITQDS